MLNPPPIANARNAIRDKSFAVDVEYASSSPIPDALIHSVRFSPHFDDHLFISATKRAWHTSSANGWDKRCHNERSIFNCNMSNNHFFISVHMIHTHPSTWYLISLAAPTLHPTLGLPLEYSSIIYYPM